MRAEAEARAREDHDRQLREEVKCLANKKLARAAKRDRQLKEQLTAVLEGQMSQAELEIDLEVEEMVEAEGSEAVRTEDVGMTGGTQSSAMEVDEEGEDGDTNASGESGQGGFSAGESGGDGDCGEYGRTMLEVR